MCVVHPSTTWSWIGFGLFKACFYTNFSFVLSFCFFFESCAKCTNLGNKAEIFGNEVDDLQLSLEKLQFQLMKQSRVCTSVSNKEECKKRIFVAQKIQTAFSVSHKIIPQCSDDISCELCLVGRMMMCTWLLLFPLSSQKKYEKLHFFVKGNSCYENRAVCRFKG